MDFKRVTAICIAIVLINLLTFSATMAQDSNGNDIPDACESNLPGYNPADPDGDGLNDACEEALAEKFKPILHKDPRDLQEDLAKPEDY